MKMSEQADAAGLNPSEGTRAGSNPAPGTTPPDPLEAAAIEVFARVDEMGTIEHAREVFMRHRHAEHSGDCTKEAHTCARCRIDEAMEVAGAAIRAYLLARGELEGTGAAWSRALAAELAPAEQEERGEKP